MKDVKIVFVQEPELRAEIAGLILNALPDWFGLPESTQAYIDESWELPFWAAYLEEKPLGFVSLKQTSQSAAEVRYMGVLPQYHRQSIGKRLMDALTDYAKQGGYRLLQVKTVDAGHYPEYDRTIAFYERMGFLRLEVFPTLWDEWNPCLVLVKAIY
ncbi:MAG: GNAT family N-acetyltransferase [Eubacteriales bacterium]|nr:GNAT family N-acetyltransferase [Eubacteriales bacterium]